MMVKTHKRKAKRKNMREGGRTTMMHAVQTIRRLSYSREARQGRQGSHKRRKICNARSHAQQQQQHPSILFLSSSRSQRALGLYTPTHHRERSSMQIGPILMMTTTATATTSFPLLISSNGCKVKGAPKNWFFSFSFFLCTALYS